MKRAISWLYPSNEEDKEEVVIPSDVWGYIINLYHHLIIKEQWIEFKQVARDCHYFILPTNQIRMPIYDHKASFPINICHTIESIYWNRNGIYAIKCKKYLFVPNSPPVSEIKGNRSIVVIRPDFLDNDKELDQLHNILIASIHKKRENPSTHFFYLVTLDTGGLELIYDVTEKFCQ